MHKTRPLAAFAAALLGLSAAAHAAADDVARVANTATLSFDATAGRQSVSSNTVSLDVERTKTPTRLSFRLLPVGYTPVGMMCQTSPNLQFTPAPIDAATLASAPATDQLDLSQPTILVLEDSGDNHDPNVRETVWITASTETFKAQVPLLETGPDTGVFAGAAPAADDTNPDIVACNPQLTRGQHFKLTFTGSDSSYGSDNSILIDPAGFVFDSQTGALVNGARVSLLDDNNQPALVYGDDGKSAYPASVVTGTSATDASGRAYPFSTGNYRFPLVAAGHYHLKIEPPANYTAPSTKSLAELASLKDPSGHPFILNDASLGGSFTLSTPDPFYADVPLDRSGDTSLLLTKTASVREASPGDFVQYQVSLTNRGTAAATGLHLTDILPAGLRYERGSTAGAQEASISTDGRNLDFSVGAVAPGGTVNVRYVVSVAPGAPVGEAVNRVLASGAGGATSNEAAASVRLRPLLFTDGFTLIGRVTEGDCHAPSSGRKGIPGIRLLLEDGTFVVTDRDGYYHVEGVRPGTHVVQLDTHTIPAAFEPVSCNLDSRQAGSAISRFVESAGGLLQRVDFQLRPTGRQAAAAEALPVAVASDADASGDHDWLAGQSAGVAFLFPAPDYNPRAPVTRVVIKHAPGQRIALSLNGALVDPVTFDTVETSADKTVATSRWTGLSLHEGDNRLDARVMGADGQLVTTLTRIVHSASIAHQAVFVPASSRLVADGMTRPLIAVRVTDRDGRPVRAGTMVPFKVDQPYAAAVDVALEQARQIAGQRAQVTARVVGDNGLAFLALQPTTHAGAVHLTVSMVDEKVTRTTDVRAWLAASARGWTVVGFGSGTAGFDTLRSHTSTLPADMKNGVVTDGQFAFYAKGRIKGSWLLTMAYDSKRVEDRDRGLLGTIDPDKYYTVYGDGSQQAYDAPTARKLYVRLERRQAYALFGDFETGLTDTKLMRYSRTLNGGKLAYEGNHVAVTAFAANTDQRYGRDEIQGNGLTGPYRLTARDIVPNSDQLRIEVRDRLRPELVLSSTNMTRHIDYDIDAVAGTIRFRAPVLGRDASLNPVFIVVDYETYGTNEKLAAGGRIAAKLAQGKVVIGASMLRDETASTITSGATVAGVDFKARPTADLELRGEFGTGGLYGLGTGRAWLAEVEEHGRRLDLLAYARSQDTSFGVGQQSLLEIGTRKLGVDARYALSDHWTLTATGWRSDRLDEAGSRIAADVRMEYRRDASTLFVGGQFADDQEPGAADRRSELLTVGGSRALFAGKVTVSGQTQFAPGGEKASADYPIRRQIMADWRITSGVRLLAGYENAEGSGYTANTARIGFDVAPWRGAKLTSTMNQQAIAENGQRTYAEYGLSQSLPLGRNWTADATLDASTTVHGHALTNGTPAITAFSTGTAGTIAGQSANDGDYVSLTGGLGYRAARWSWNGRLEYRRADRNGRWGITTNLLRSLGEGKTLAASVKYYSITDNTGATAAYGTADLALAWRPANSRWSVLDRLQFRNERADAGFTDTNVLGVAATGAAFQATLRAINNLALNYRTGSEGDAHGMEATIYYGSKWVRGSFGTDDYTGYVDAIGVDIRKDLGRFDIGLQGSVQHAWERGVVSYSYGPSVGMTPGRNIWVTAGYNLAGYRDRDFEADRYTRSGPYVTMRLKFDQLSLGAIARTVRGDR